MPGTLSFSYLITLIVFVSVHQNDKKIPFNLLNPEIKIELSKELKEISGLSWFGEDQIAAVQDESGTVYLLDANNGTISEKLFFSLPGDFEGIEAVNNIFYAITSRGTLYAFDKLRPKQATRIVTPFSRENDVEGLGYDHKNNRLLIACKEDGGLADYKIKGKGIYGFSLEDTTLSKKPVIIISKSEVAKLANTDKFKPSALAIDPLTQDLYVLASSGNLLVILNSDNEIKSVAKLPASIYEQPEGICFSPIGDLYISNEGKNKKANIYHLLRQNQ